MSTYRIIGEPYVGPPGAPTSRLALLKQLSAKARIIRPVLATYRTPQGLPGWVAKQGRAMMTLYGPEGGLYRRWKMTRDAWIKAGCPKGLSPWQWKEASRQ